MGLHITLELFSTYPRLPQMDSLCLSVCVSFDLKCEVLLRGHREDWEGSQTYHVAQCLFPRPPICVKSELAIIIGLLPSFLVG